MAEAVALPDPTQILNREAAISALQAAIEQRKAIENGRAEIDGDRQRELAIVRQALQFASIELRTAFISVIVTEQLPETMPEVLNPDRTKPLEDLIELINLANFDGRPTESTALGKLLETLRDARVQLKEVIGKQKAIVAEVNQALGKKRGLAAAHTRYKKANPTEGDSLPESLADEIHLQGWYTHDVPEVYTSLLQDLQKQAGA